MENTIYSIKLDKLEKIPKQSQSGKNYYLYKIESGNKKLSAFANDWNQDWCEGMTVQARVVKNGQFYNLENPKQTSENNTSKSSSYSNSDKKLYFLEKKVDRILSILESHPDVPWKSSKDIEDVNKQLRDESEKAGDFSFPPDFIVVPDEELPF